jgi:RNA polymerase sigma-70 factor (ECF subfamily)
MATCYQLVGLADGLATPAFEDDAKNALARGDVQALRDAYRTHHEAVRAFARRLLGSDADAEEIVQEVFVGLPSAVRRFRGDCSFSTFMMSVAVNQARHFLRAAGRRRAAHARFAEEQRSHEVAAPAADACAAQEELAGQLLRAMSQLSDEQRLAFVLCDVEERSSSEAARILELPASTVRSRLAAARENLRALLSEVSP